MTRNLKVKSKTSVTESQVGEVVVLNLYKDFKEKKELLYSTIKFDKQ